MGILTRSRRDLSRLQPSDVEPISPAGGFTFVRFDGSIYALEDTPLASESVARPLAPGEIRIATREVRMEFGTAMEHTLTRRGTLFSDERYAELLELDAKRARRTGPKAIRVVDALDAVPFFAGRTGRVVAPPQTGGLVVPVSGHPDGEDGILAGQVRGGVFGHRVPVRGATKILRAFAKVGVAVVLTDDGQHVVGVSAGGRDPGVGQALVAAAPLLVAHLRDGRADCGVTAHDAEAVTVALGGALWCGTCQPATAKESVA